MSRVRRLRGCVAVTAAAAAGIGVLSAAPSFASDTVYSGPVGGTWDSDGNWRQAGADLTFGTGDDVFVQPGTADAAIILDGSTVNLSSTETVLELQVSSATSPADTSTTHGVAQLNVGAGAVLTTNGNSSGIRLGRALDPGQALGTSTGQIFQSGGVVNVAQGANGLRLSQADSGNLANSYYEISGGVVRGAASSAVAAVSDMRVGNTANAFQSAEFHVVGSAATEIRFLDVQVADSTTGSGGRSIFHFSLDAGGITPIVAEDEFQFRTASAVGSGLLQVDLAAEAPQADVTLVRADRLGNNGGALERFTNFADGDTLIATGAGWQYTYTVDYTDASDDFNFAAQTGLDASIVLHYVSRTAVPEPGSLALLGLGGLGLLRRRQRA